MTGPMSDTTQGTSLSLEEFICASVFLRVGVCDWKSN